MPGKPSEVPEMLDPAQRLALAYAPAAARDAWLALFLFDQRLAETARPGREPLMIQLRLSWWRDRLGEQSVAWPVSEPVLGQLKAWREQHGPLVKLVDGWEALVIAEDGGAELAQARAEALEALARLLGVEDLSSTKEAARQFVDPQTAPTTVRAIPREMRPLAVLRAMARREARGGPPTPIRDLVRIMWAGLTGR
jgi:phytoene synthase